MDVIAERVLDLEGRPVTVRIGRPEQHTEKGVTYWLCSVQWEGIDVPMRSSFGIDSAEALLNALDMVARDVQRHDTLVLPELPGNVHDDPTTKRNPWPFARGPAWLPVDPKA